MFTIGHDVWKLPLAAVIIVADGVTFVRPKLASMWSVTEATNDMHSGAQHGEVVRFPHLFVVLATSVHELHPDSTVGHLHHELIDLSPKGVMGDPGLLVAKVPGSPPEQHVIEIMHERLGGKEDDASSGANAVNKLHGSVQGAELSLFTTLDNARQRLADSGVWLFTVYAITADVGLLGAYGVGIQSDLVHVRGLYG